MGYLDLASENRYDKMKYRYCGRSGGDFFYNISWSFGEIFKNTFNGYRDEVFISPNAGHEM